MTGLVIPRGAARGLTDPKTRETTARLQHRKLYGKGRNRNQPCPCGSGLKLKRCHGR